MANPLKELNLGQKIRKLRESRGLTGADFAAELGLNAAVLKQLETGEISPPIATLLNMAHHSGVELGAFFDLTKEDKPYTLVRKGKARATKRLLPKGKNPLSYSYKSLAAEKTAKHMEPFLMEFTPRKEKIPQVAHDGEEFIYVLSGSLEFKLDGQKMKLGEGDSLYFESRRPHSFTALGKSKARAIVVLYPH